MPTDPTAAEQQLKTLLTELLQLDDAARLDFGIYKILALRREELSRFLDTLAGEVRAELLASGARSHEAAKAAVAEFVSGSLKLGMTYDEIYGSSRHKTLTEQLAGAIEPGQLAQEVFESLVTFFARYWDEGDFIAAPRYSRDQYAIPYDGSEVALHWANRDQYYVKSSLFLNDMVVKEPHFPGRLVIKLVSAVSDRDNVKAADANKRRFMLADDGQPDVVAEGDDLTLRLRYAPTAPPAAAAPPKAKGRKKAEPEAEAPAEPGRAPKQDLLNVVIAEALLAAASPAWRAALSRPAGPEKDAESTLTRHLRRYTKQNTADFFIHKNLGRFLRRELDFFIKNELFDLDHIDTVSEDTLRKRVVKVRALRRLAVKLIDWLHQLEEFQRRLFLKKKFVLRTDWAITLDRVPRALWPEIAQNKAQREEWVRLFRIDRIDSVEGELIPQAKYSEPLTSEFLAENQALVVNTRHFDRGFNTRLLTALGDAAGSMNGTFINADAQAALLLLGASEQNAITAVVTDPIYNTGADSFKYKDGYPHSTWLCAIYQTLTKLPNLLNATSSIWATIDDNEHDRLKIICADLFGAENFVATVVWQKRTSPDIRATIGAAHDYFDVWAIDRQTFAQSKRQLPATAARIADYKNPDNDPEGPWASVDLTGQTGHATASQFLPLVAPDGQEFPVPPGRCWAISQTEFTRLWNDNRIWLGPDGSARPRKKRYLSELEGVPAWSWWSNQEAGTNEEARKILIDMNVPDEGQTPKPTRLFMRAALLADPSSQGIILDPFAGSGTTGHAVINLNREDGGDRRFVLVEMGDHFDTVLVPRVLKATYSKDWKDGAPVDRKGVSALYKILRLESYDDTLENITLRRDDSSRAVLFDKDGQPTSLGESYLLKYQLALESRASRLQSERFDKPFHATLKALAPRPDGRGGVAVQAVPVDMVETFNLLLGLRARRMWSMTNDGQQALLVSGVVRDGADWTTPVVVLWWDTQDVKEETLVSWLKGLRAREDDVIGPARLRYVNGDASFSRLWAEDEPWTPLEPEFQRRMFDVAEEG